MSNAVTDKEKGQLWGICDLPNSKPIKKGSKVGEQNSPTPKMNKNFYILCILGVRSILAMFSLTANRKMLWLTQSFLYFLYFIKHYTYFWY